MIVALAVKFPWKKTFIGIAAAFALLNVGAVVLGKILFAFLPLFWIKMASAGLFLFELLQKLCLTFLKSVKLFNAC